MGVDMTTYLLRIGGFSGGGMSLPLSSLFTFILLAIVISNLLLRAGIEPNPGPDYLYHCRYCEDCNCDEPHTVLVHTILYHGGEEL